MNVAICISGSVRYPELGLSSIKNICPNENIKIFIHTWNNVKNKEFLNTLFRLKCKEIPEMVKVDLNCIEKYQYEKLIIEDYKEKHKEFVEIYKSLKFKEYLRNDVGIISMHYSIYKSNQLKCNYEKEHNMLFDRVVRMRFDSDFESKVLNLSDHSQHDLYIPDIKEDHGGINDQFAIGSSESMNKYSDLYNNLKNLQLVPYQGEILLRLHLKYHKLNVHRIDFPIKINNGIDFRKYKP